MMSILVLLFEAVISILVMACVLILPLMLLVLFIFILFKIFTIPISIAKTKKLQRNDLMTIRILTWCGLFVVLTWFIALFMALFYKKNNKD